MGFEAEASAAGREVDSCGTASTMSLRGSEGVALDEGARVTGAIDERDGVAVVFAAGFVLPCGVINGCIGCTSVAIEVRLTEVTGLGAV